MITPLVVGAVVGLVVGALGGGGGVLTVPILVYLLDQDPHVAATSSLVIVGFTSLTALIPHARAGNVRWRAGAAFALLATVGTVAGAALSRLVGGTTLMAGFAVLLLVVAALMLARARRPRDTSTGPTAARSPAASGSPAADGSPAGTSSSAAIRSPAPAPGPVWRRAAQIVFWASLVGVLTGFFGVGGGFAVVPALTLALGFGMRAAVGTSLLVIVVNSAVGLVARLGTHPDVDWVLVATFTAASIVAGQLGARVSARVRPRTLSLAFGLLLAAVAVATAAQVLAELT
ncbi:sulfite exporter TauE/SafE family protein [Georgenia soli]|uniref:sulfite exporter TauE/SafE family protein n=1 Tax=Georgenia soli TaxID=638953 RepID=UPI001FE3A10B|nr:sulfite exporter TauE/SafE family protein [Georgenia soli]